MAGGLESAMVGQGTAVTEPIGADLPPSLWAATAAPGGATERLDGSVGVDVAIVGGGFTGLSAALHLAGAGVRAAMLEAHEPGWGGSGRNGGQVIAGWKDDPDTLVARHGVELGLRMARLGDGAAELVYDLIERHGIACDLQRGGWLHALHAPAARPAAEQRARAWQRLGAPVRMLDAAETNALLGTDIYAGGYLDPRGAGLNPLGYARGLARAAMRAGVRIFAPAAATGLLRENGSWIVEAGVGRVIAQHVLLATGAYSGELLPRLRRSVLPVQSIQVATEVLAEEIRRTITPGGQVASDTRRLLLYFRRDAAGRLVFGGRGALSGERPAAARLRAVVAAMHRTFPATRGLPLAFAWAGLVDLTHDRRLHVHQLAKGLTAVVGLNGRGVAQATAIGKALAEAIAAGSFAGLPLPVVALRPIPLHGLRLPAMALVAAGYDMRDRLEAALR